MLRIRLQRFGKKKAPVYRIAVLEKSQKRDGKPVEVLGFYNPKTKDLILNTERSKYWQSHGAQASDTVATLLKREPIHDLVNGPYKAKAQTRADKEKVRLELVKKSTKNTKAKKKKSEQASAPAEEASSEETSTQETPTDQETKTEDQEASSDTTSEETAAA